MEEIRTKYLQSLKESVKLGKSAIGGSKLYLDRGIHYLGWGGERVVYDETNLPLGKKVVRLYLPWVDKNNPQVFESHADVPEGFYIEYSESLPSRVNVGSQDQAKLRFEPQLVGLYTPSGELYGTAWCRDDWLSGLGRNYNWVWDSYKPYLYLAPFELPEGEVHRFVGKAKVVLDNRHDWLENAEDNTLKNLFVSVIQKQKLGLSFLLRVGGLLDLRLRLYAPALARETQGNISIFQNAEKRTRDLRTSMKPGRAFRFIFPEATDRETELFVDAFRKEFPTQELTIKEGKGREDFKHMYQHKISPTENISTSAGRKSLSCSCMRYNFGGVHPAEAYASGEFTALWSEDLNGNIASRVVVHDPSKTFGPIYGTTEFSVDILQGKLKDQGYKLGEDDAWLGAKVQLIEKNGGYAFPYVDFGLVPNVGTATYENGIEVAELIFNEDDLPTGGIFYPDGEGRCYCEYCDTRIYEEDVYSSPYGEILCEDCYLERFGCCDYTGETVAVEDLCEAYWKNTWNPCYCGMVCVNSLHEDFTETYTGEWYHNDLVVELANGDYAYEKDDCVAQSDLTSEWHHTIDMDYSVDGDTYATDEEFRDAGYTKTDAGWELVEEEETESV